MPGTSDKVKRTKSQVREKGQFAKKKPEIIELIEIHQKEVFDKEHVIIVDDDDDDYNSEKEDGDVNDIWLDLFLGKLNHNHVVKYKSKFRKLYTGTSRATVYRKIAEKKKWNKQAEEDILNKKQRTIPMSFCGPCQSAPALSTLNINELQTSQEQGNVMNNEENGRDNDVISIGMDVSLFVYVYISGHVLLDYI